MNKQTVTLVFILFLLIGLTVNDFIKNRKQKQDNQPKPEVVQLEEDQPTIQQLDQPAEPPNNPLLPPPPVEVMSEIVVQPKEYYLLQRQSRITDDGVESIPMGAKVETNGWSDDLVTITYNGVSFRVHPSLLTDSPPIAQPDTPIPTSLKVEQPQVQPDYRAHNQQVQDLIKATDLKIRNAHRDIDEIEARERRKIPGRVTSGPIQIRKLKQYISELETYKQYLIRQIK